MAVISKQMIGQFSQASFQNDVFCTQCLDLIGSERYQTCINLKTSINLKTLSVNSPDIYFSTDVRQELDSTVGKECAIVYQSFSFKIAQSDDIMIQDTDHSLGAFVVRVSKTRTRRRPGAQAVVRDWVTYAVPQIDQNNPEKTKADDIHVIFAIPQIEFQLDTIQNQELRLPAFPEPQKVS